MSQEAPKPSTAVAAAAARDRRVEQVLEQCWEIVSDRLVSRIDRIFQEVMQAATRSGDPAQLRGARVLALEGRALEKSYRAALRSAFSQRVESLVQDRSGLAQAPGLSLLAIDDSDLGNQLQQASKRLGEMVQESGSAVRLRLQGLLGGREIPDALSPLRERLFLEAAAHALSSVIVGAEDVAALLRQLPAALAPALASTYEAIVVTLDSKGLAPAAPAMPAPVLRPPPTVRTAVPPSLAGATLAGAHTRSGAEPTRTGSRAVPLRFSLPSVVRSSAGGTGHDEAALIEYGRLQALAGVNAAGLVDAAIDAARALALGRTVAALAPSGTLLEALHHAQKHDAARLAATDRSREGVAAPPAGEDEGTRELGRKLIAQTGQPQHKLAIQLVARIITRMERDRLVSPPVREQLLFLRVPLIEVALSDPSLFVRWDHPARALIDAIGTSCIGRTLDASPPARRYLHHVRAAVQFVVHSPGSAASAFVQALGQFSERTQAELAKQDEQFASERAALAQAEERELRASAVGQFLREILEGARLESGLRDFLLRVWPRVLVEAAAREASEPGLGKRLLNLVPDLVWSVQPLTAATDRKRLVEIIPNVVSGLWDGARLIAWPDARIQTLLDELMLAHSKVLKGAEVPAGGVFSVSTVRIRLDGARIDEIARGVPERQCAVLEEAVAQYLAASKSGVAHQWAEPPAKANARLGRDQAQESVDGWRAGSWFDLRVEHRDARVRLQAYSPAGTLALFRAADTGARYSLSRESLVNFLCGGRIAPVESMPLTARALRRVLKDLERSAQSEVNRADGAG